MEEIIADIVPIIEEAKKLGVSIMEGKRYSQPVDESQLYKSSVFGQKYRIIETNYWTLIQEKLTEETDSLLVIPICGMPGVGKTTLAKSIYEDVNFMAKNFPYKAWVTVSQDASVHDILGMLLHTLESRGQRAGERKYEGDEAKLRVELHKALYNNKYLVVIDDSWDEEVLMRVLRALPDNGNSSRVLVTTRIFNVAKTVTSTDVLVMEPLSSEDSWTFLRNKTFGDDQECPANLENLGRRIAKHCRSLPLSLSVIGGLLSQGSKEPGYWQSIEEDTYAATSDVNSEDAYLEILSLSYDHLPCRLKGCFLYMAAFPEDSVIPVSKLIKLWVAEGFITMPPLPHLQMSLEKAAEESLLDLIDRNLVIMHKKGYDGRVKACKMHSDLRDLGEKESQKDMFFHSRKTYSQRVVAGTNSQRRVFVHNNILMCLEDVYKSTKTIEKARSLVFTGQHHHHPMPSTLPFDLLRVLDAFTLFFIQFPDEILKLIHLRYLSFTYNGKLPSKLSKLHKLQVLIVKRLPKCIYVGISFIPDEIWNMKELRHLIVTETDLPPLLSPTEAGSVLFENLQTLSNVNATSCTQEVLEHMPNLKKLVMWVESPGKVGFYLKKLDQLEIFKFAVVEPIPGKGIEFQPKLFLPDTVRKLNLSGTGLPWVDMEVIAALPNLEVLKLKEFAFHGDEWCLTYIFKKLKFLLVEYLNLRMWEADISNFPCLEQLFLKHCYDLEMLPSEFAEGVNLRLIELVDCSPEAVNWAKEVEDMVECYGQKIPLVRIYALWE